MGPFLAGGGGVFSGVTGAGATPAGFGGLLLPGLLEKGLKDDRLFSLALLVVACVGVGTRFGSGLAWFAVAVCTLTRGGFLMILAKSPKD